MRYTGAKTRAISFPLGGIGTGCIGLAGNGRLIDWEIFNRPAKGNTNGFSHFAIKAEQNGVVLDARVLHGDLPPPYMGEMGNPDFSGFGFGPSRYFMAGLPHFRDVEFIGEFPIAYLAFKDRSFPGHVRLTAFNPFIPLNDRDSGIPAAFFEFEVDNTTGDIINYTIAGTLRNPLPANNIHTCSFINGCHTLYMTSDAPAENAPEYGNLALATDAPDVRRQTYWFRGSWFDNLEVFWRDFTNPAPLQDRIYEGAQAGADNHATLAGQLRVYPGRRAMIRFVFAWSFPNFSKYWGASDQTDCSSTIVWKNYYASLFEDARESAIYSLTRWDGLFRETLRFKQAIYVSDLPEPALDAVSANLSVLKTSTVIRLENGAFYGWEGCHPSSGCCEGSCAHVWNYAQALPFLFPALERSMRSMDYENNMREDGGMAFRLQLPPGRAPSTFRPCADGQFGGVMKAYRDWKISGDSRWLRSIWPSIRKSIEYAWADTNLDRWDPEKTGTLHGRQHHTLDMELFGPNSWLTGFYLGALKAGAEMAEYLDDTETAGQCRALFEKGKKWVDTHLFNGSYYHQRIDLKDRSLLDEHDRYNLMNADAARLYWNEEHQEIKYQIGEGCGIDQVLAQWHANLYGLGEIFDPEQTRTALKNLFQNNFKKPMRAFYNPWRVFCLNDEAGLVICDWPEGACRPMIPLTYAQETQNGYEYAAAIQMIQSGLVREGAAVVAAIRDRYDGEKRNPWNEIECGSNYARSMASYALLNAYSGFHFDMVHGMIGFNPVMTRKKTFQCFWSLDSGWGRFILQSNAVFLDVLSGYLTIQTLSLPFLRPGAVVRIYQGRDLLPFTAQDGAFCLEEPATIVPGKPLEMLRRRARTRRKS